VSAFNAASPPLKIFGGTLPGVRSVPSSMAMRFIDSIAGAR
jgi:hypothetical protein